MTPAIFDKISKMVTPIIVIIVEIQFYLLQTLTASPTEY